MKNTTIQLACILVSFSLMTGCASMRGHQSKIIHNSTAQSNEKLPSHDLVVKDVSQETQVGRYVTLHNGPTNAQINPLLAVSIFKFPPSIYTIKQAVKQVLSTTGYRLSDNLSQDVKYTLKQPLPITVRRLGPMKIQTALNVLMGSEVYNLQRDPLHRMVNFEIKPSIAKALGENKNV